jgi:uncharacterized protein YhaN
MASWLESVANLRAQGEELERARTALKLIDSAVKGVIPTLVQLADDLGLEPLKGVSPSLLTPRVDERLREIADAWQERRAFDGTLNAAQKRVQRLEQRQEDIQKQHAEWLLRWQPAIAGVNLSVAIIEQAQASIELWQIVPEQLNERDNRSRRVASMKRDMDRFVERIATLIGQLPVDLGTLSPDAALKKLNESLAAANQANSVRTEAQKRVIEAAKIREDANAESAAANDALKKLTSLFPEKSDLAVLCEKLKRRDHLLDTVSKMKGQLLSQGEGQDEDTLRHDLVAFNPDVAATTLRTLETEYEQLDRQAKETFAEHKKALDEKDALEKGVGAEVAWVSRRSAEAELATAARDYSVLKLGALLLGASFL